MLTEYKRTYFNMIKMFLTLIKNAPNMSSTDVYKLYIKYLKESIKFGTNKLSFNEDINKYRFANCYAYALGLQCSKISAIFLNLYEYKEIEKFYYNTGFTLTSEERAKLFPIRRTIAQDIELMMMDFKNLGIKSYESDINAKVEHDGYKIAIYEYFNDYHFVRQNFDGSWSHKLGYSNKFVQIDNPPKEILHKYSYVKTIEIVKPVIQNK